MRAALRSMRAARRGSSSRCAVSRDAKGYTGFRHPDAPGIAPPRIATLSNWGQAQPWSIVTAGKIITGSGAVLCSVVVSVATT